MQRVLIFSDDRELKDAIQNALPATGYRCDEFRDKHALLDQAGTGHYQVIVLDARTVGGDLDTVSMLREQGPHHIVWLTEASGLGGAAEAIRRGADFYLTLPLDATQLRQVLAEWDQPPTPEEPVRWLPDVVPGDRQEEGIIGRSEAIRRVFRLAERVAPTDSPVLITGETGVGKEVVARTIHRLSDRANRTFVAINCAAIPEALLESELFGYRKGAFTGATGDHTGLFEQASGGTFFLDEIGELSSSLQVKLLRVLEDHHIRPLGGVEEVRVDIRILAATHRDLAEEVRSGRFRMDLFYRINVIHIHIPPLRERPEDIPALIKLFLQKYNQRFRKNVISITRDALYGLMHYDYPGNIRELENIVQHGVVLSEDHVMTKTSLPPQVFQKAQLAIPGPARDQGTNLQRAEEDLIKQALTQFEGNQTEAAKSLGISRSTLWRKIKTYKLENFK